MESETAWMRSCSAGFKGCETPVSSACSVKLSMPSEKKSRV